MYGPVLGAATTTVAGLALPNTGSNKLIEAGVVLVFVAGLIVTIVSVARLMRRTNTNA